MRCGSLAVTPVTQGPLPNAGPPLSRTVAMDPSALPGGMAPGPALVPTRAQPQWAPPPVSPGPFAPGALGPPPSVGLAPSGGDAFGRVVVAFLVALVALLASACLNPFAWLALVLAGLAYSANGHADLPRARARATWSLLLGAGSIAAVFGAVGWWLYYIGEI